MKMLKFKNIFYVIIAALSLRSECLANDYDQRLEYLEEQYRIQNGKFEEFEHKIKELEEKFTKLSQIKEEASKKQSNAKVKGIDNTEAMADLEAAIKLYKDQKLKQAKLEFIEITKLYPNHAVTGTALYWLGEIYLKEQAFDQASASFLKSYKNYPAGRKAPDSLFKLATTLIRLKKTAEACKILSNYSQKFPKADKAILTKISEIKKSNKCS